MTVTLYTFGEGPELEPAGTFTTFKADEAREYAKQNHLAVIANEYEWTEAIPVEEWDYRPEQKRTDLVTVTFEWSNEHGECYECGRPAAFLVGDRRESFDTADLRCAVCAANAAVDGETIIRVEGDS